MWLHFSRILRTSLQQMQRHGWQTVAAMAVISLTFFVISLFILVGLASNAVIKQLEEMPNMQVYFKQDVEESRVQEVQASLESTGWVKTMVYTDKETALRNFQEQFSDSPEITSGLTSNIFPPTLDISPYELDQLDDLNAFLEAEKYDQFIDEVRYQRDVTDKLASWTSTSRLIGLGLITFLILVSFVIMLVTIGLNIASYKNEIEVMRLVGASNWYIRGPFVLEGILYGTFAAILAVGIVYATLPLIAPRLQSWFTGLSLFPVPVFSVFGGMLVFEIVLGSLLGLLGAAVAMRRSLRV